MVRRKRILVLTSTTLAIAAVLIGIYATQAHAMKQSGWMWSVLQVQPTTGKIGTVAPVRARLTEFFTGNGQGAKSINWLPPAQANVGQPTVTSWTDSQGWTTIYLAIPSYYRPGRYYLRANFPGDGNVMPAVSVGVPIDITR